MLTVPFTLGHNHRRILETLRLNGPLPRINVAELTDLQPATLTRLSQDLISWGFIEDADYDSVAESKSSAKRKTRLLRLNGKLRHTAGIAVTLDRVACSISSLSGKIIAETRIHADLQEPQNVAEEAAEALTNLLRAARLKRNQLLAAGLSLPINFGDDPERQFIPSEWPKWEIEAPREIFEAKLGIPTWVENDAHAAALAESYFGAGESMESFNLIYLGYGIGGGNIISRQLFRGSCNNAAAIGSLFPQDSFRPSGRDLLKTLAALGERYDSLFDLPDDLGVDPRMEPWLHRVAKQIFPVVRHAQVLFNGEAVVIGGLLPSSVNQALVARLRELSKGRFSATRILASTISRENFHLGAACIPQYELTAPHKYKGRVVKGLR